MLQYARLTLASCTHSSGASSTVQVKPSFLPVQFLLTIFSISTSPCLKICQKTEFKNLLLKNFLLPLFQIISESFCFKGNHGMHGIIAWVISRVPFVSELEQIIFHGSSL